MTIILLILIFALPIIFTGGCVYLAYIIPAISGYPNLGRFLSAIFFFSFLYLAIVIVFEEELFSEQDALEILAQEQIELQDEAELVSYQSEWAIGEEYQLFTLKISARDKTRIISKIISHPDFNIHKEYTHRENGKRITMYYEEKNYFVFETCQPSGKSGYSPTNRFVKISKTRNLLYFEDIDD